MRRLLAVVVALGAGCGRVGFDVATDAETDPDDANGAAFCASLSPAPTFCDDFEAGTLEERWSELIFSRIGGLTTLPDPDPTKSRVFRANMMPFAEDCQYSVLAKKIDGAYTRAVLDFDLLIPGGLPERTNPFAAVVFEDGSANSCRTLSYDDTFGEQTITDADVRQNASESFDTLSRDVWQHVAITYDITPGANQMSMSVDGQSVGDRPTMYPCLIPAGYVRIYVGIYCTNPANEIDTRFDNFTLSVE